MQYIDLALSLQQYHPIYVDEIVVNRKPIIGFNYKHGIIMYALE